MVKQLSKKPIPKLSHQLIEFVFRHCPESEAGKLSSLKLQSLFDTTADRIEKMKQLHGNDFDKKINLQASLSYCITSIKIILRLFSCYSH